MLQALAMEIPALVSDINGCNEIVANGHNGIIFPAKNSEAVEKAMRVCLNSEKYNNLKSASRASVDKYKQSVVWELLKDNYDSLLN